MIDEEVDDFLEHHGIKGQKWGVRRREQAQLHKERLARVANGTATKQDKSLIRARRVGEASLIGAGVITVGVIAANSVLKRRGSVPITRIIEMPEGLDKLSTQAVADLMSNRGAFG